MCLVRRPSGFCRAYREGRAVLLQRDPLGARAFPSLQRQPALAPGVPPVPVFRVPTLQHPGGQNAVAVAGAGGGPRAWGWGEAGRHPAAVREANTGQQGGCVAHAGEPSRAGVGACLEGLHCDDEGFVRLGTGGYWYPALSTSTHHTVAPLSTPSEIMPHHAIPCHVMSRRVTPRLSKTTSKSHPALPY
jgi:hypothetical protein